MFIWGISSKLTRRKGGGGGGHAGGDSGGGGDFGGGESGDGESSGYGSGKGGNNGNAQESNSGKGGKGSLKTSKVKGLPSNHNKATTYGPGGGDSFTVTSGRFKGLLFGGGSRDHVYGSSYRPTGPVISNVVPFGFFDVNGYLEPLNTSQGYAYLNFYGLPQNNTRPGGAVVELKILPKANGTSPFFFVSDSFSAGEVKRTILQNCSDVTIDGPIPFNSTGDLQFNSVVQLYRGDSAAILLHDYNNTVEVPGNQSLVPNPPFPASINMSTWACLNYTIGESIPLMNAAIVPSPSIATLWCFLFFSLLRMVF